MQKNLPVVMGFALVACGFFYDNTQFTNSSLNRTSVYTILEQGLKNNVINATMDPKEI
jgi:hypothetical protein